MALLVLSVLLTVLSPSLAQYDNIWEDVLAGNDPPATTTMIGLFFRNMMNPAPGAEDPTLVSRSEFKAYWIQVYGDSEKIADGLFSFFDHQKDEYIDAQDIPPMMNIADTNANGVLSQGEFNDYMTSAYEYAGQRRLSPGNIAHGHNHAHNGHQQHHGKPFYG